MPSRATGRVATDVRRQQRAGRGDAQAGAEGGVETDARRHRPSRARAAGEAVEGAARARGGREADRGDVAQPVAVSGDLRDLADALDLQVFATAGLLSAGRRETAAGARPAFAVDLDQVATVAVGHHLQRA